MANNYGETLRGYGTKAKDSVTGLRGSFLDWVESTYYGNSENEYFEKAFNTKSSFYYFTFTGLTTFSAKIMEYLTGNKLFSMAAAIATGVTIGKAQVEVCESGEEKEKNTSDDSSNHINVTFNSENPDLLSDIEVNGTDESITKIKNVCSKVEEYEKSSFTKRATLWGVNTALCCVANAIVGKVVSHNLSLIAKNPIANMLGLVCSTYLLSRVMDYRFEEDTKFAGIEFKAGNSVTCNLERKLVEMLTSKKESRAGQEQSI